MVSLGTTWSGAQEPGGVGESAPKPASGAAEVTFEMVRPGLAVPRFRITVREDGTGSYAGDQVVAPAPTGGGTPSDSPTSHVEREIGVSAGTAAKIFKTARAEKMFAVACASKAKNIADTGQKTLRYAGPDGRGECHYNYSENKGVMVLTDLFVAMGATIEEGRKLEFQHRFDHLGLDAELDSLEQASETGRSVELGTIAPVLRSLAGDTELMERVRLRAAKLLDRAGEGK